MEHASSVVEPPEVVEHPPAARTPSACGGGKEKVGTIKSSTSSSGKGIARSIQVSGWGKTA